MAVYLLVALLHLSLAATDPQATQRNAWMSVSSGTSTHAPEASLLSDAHIGLNDPTLHKTSMWDKAPASMALNTLSESLAHLQSPYFELDAITKHACSRSWFYPNNSSNGSTVCECGSELEGRVKCNNETKEIQVPLCYCMTYNVQSDLYVVGTCIYACFSTYNMHYTIPSWANATELNSFMCGADSYLKLHQDVNCVGDVKLDMLLLHIPTL